MQRILLAAFLRGIGGGLALAATPYILAAGHGAVRGTAKGVRRVRGWVEDTGDCLRYYGELRGHRKMQRKQPTTWHPEADGFEVE
jgi:hypothetical protein